MATFETNLRTVLGGSAKKFADAFDLHTVADLLRHYPRRYITRGDLTSLRDLLPGDAVTVFAEVKSASSRKIRDKLLKTDIVVTDGVTDLTLTFFNQRFRETAMPPGTQGFFAGTVERYGRRLSLTHPEVEIPVAGDSADTFSGSILPVYAASAKSKLSTFVIHNAVGFALDSVDFPDDPLPEEIRERFGLIAFADAFEKIHRPETDDDWREAQQRLRFDEAFQLQVAVALRRAQATATPTRPRPVRAGGLVEAFDASLPFRLTAGQQQMIEEIATDLGTDHPMHRLLQGEVGSGKTVVALRAMLAVVDSGGQAALLAPTEVLAQQHHRSITAMLGPLAQAGQLGGADTATRVALLTGSMNTAARREALLAVASGDAGIVVGTHALLQENVTFFDLGLVVVDEQHRFGVEQRDALRAKGEQPPHVLVMTATPIPRTIAMTVYGDLETSTLRELPTGRSDVRTVVVAAGDQPEWLDRAWQRVCEEVDAGHQAFVVCPRIGDASGGAEEDADGEETPDGAATTAVLDLAPMLTGGPLAALRVGVLHGRMPATDKDAVMQSFAAGDIDVLVATTVVEVGVDIPNATVMVIMDAERFGVSQLHQLRGRIGRGTAPGLCLLVSTAAAGSSSRERLDAVAGTRDGFKLAELDLQQRHEGTILGQQQHGRSDLRLLSLLDHRDVIDRARAEAQALVAADPSLDGHSGLRAALDRLADRGGEYLEKA